MFCVWLFMDVCDVCTRVQARFMCVCDVCIYMCVCMCVCVPHSTPTPEVYESILMSGAHQSALRAALAPFDVHPLFLKEAPSYYEMDSL